MKDALPMGIRHIKKKKKIVLKKHTEKIKTVRKPPKMCPRCHKKIHWAKDYKSKFDIDEKPIPKNSKQGTPPPPTSGPLPQKPETNFIISLKPSTSDSAAVDIPALNDFFLYPQTVPSRVPTRLFGPLPAQTFSLLLGPSSLTSKKITVHPEIIDSDYKTKIQIMMSSQIL